MKLKRKIENDDFHLTDLESFVKDVYDPSQFMRAFVQTLDPKTQELVPADPYSYQEAWLQDDSKLKIALKSRQVGFSFIEMLGKSLHTAITTPNYTKLVMSIDQPKANELINIITETVPHMKEEFQIPFKSKSRSRVEFENGSRIIAVPSLASATRSYHGDVFIDEIAFIPNDKEVLDAVLGTTVRGYNVSIGSTPYGQRGVYHEIIQKTGWDTSSVWLNESEIMPFTREYFKVRDNNPTDWSFHAIPYFLCPDLKREDLHSSTEDGFKQEYGLAFLDESTSMLSYDLLMSRSFPHLGQWALEGKFVKPAKSRFIMGLDPAEKINQTAIIIFEKKNNTYYKRYRKSWQGVNHKIYIPQIVELFKRFDIDHLYVDGTGIGYSVYLDILEYLPKSKVSEIQLTSSRKEELVHNLISIYEADEYQDRPLDFTLAKMEGRYNIITDNDVDYFDQLHQLRREVTDFGKPRYTGKIEGKDDDIIWATALALMEDIKPKGKGTRTTSVPITIKRSRY
jgi:hypothetical protein